MENQKRGFTSPSKLKAAIVYVLMIFVGSTLFSILFSMLAASIRGVDPNTVANSFWSTDAVTQEILDCQIIGQGYGNALGYLISLAGIMLWMRNDFITDYKALCEKKKFYAIIIPTLAIAFAGLAVFVDFVFSLWANDSENQSTIVEILHSDARIPMIISTILLAPVVEEMIYRKAIFSALKPYNLPLAYAMSILLFALPHMLAGASSVGMWFLQLIPYLLCGGMLCAVYHLSKYNVYASIAAHMLNNIIAVILVFV